MGDGKSHRVGSTVPFAGILTASVLLTCTACSNMEVPSLPTQVNQPYYGAGGALEGRHLVFEHAFNDSAAAETRRRANNQCSQRREAAVETSRTCSLTLCTVRFICMNKADAANFRTNDGGK